MREGILINNKTLIGNPISVLGGGASVHNVSKNHKKLVATVSRREGVYNRAGEPSVTFCKKGEARKQADDFFA